MSNTSTSVNQEILRQLTDDKMLITEQSLGEIMSVDPVVYGFDVGPLTLLHDPYFQAEIIEDARIAPIPNTQNWFMGMFALRGHLIPVFDIGSLVSNTNSNSDANMKIVIIGANEEAAAIQIKSLPERILPDSLVLKEEYDVPEFVEPSIRAAHSVEQTLWLDPDYPYFFELLGEHVGASGASGVETEITH